MIMMRITFTIMVMAVTKSCEGSLHHVHMDESHECSDACGVEHDDDNG